MSSLYPKSARTPRPESLHAYLQELSREEIDKVYGGDSWVCQATLRALSPLAKLVFMRLLFVTEDVPLSKIRAWGVREKQSGTVIGAAPPRSIQIERAVNEMQSYKIADVISIENSSSNAARSSRRGSSVLECLRLNPIFQRVMKTAILSPPGAPWQECALDVMVNTAAKRKRDEIGETNRWAMSVEMVEKESTKNWNNVLRTLIRLNEMSMQDTDNLSMFIVKLLVRTGLLIEASEEEEEDLSDAQRDAAPFVSAEEVHVDVPYKISRVGYRYLLRSTSTQLWMVLYTYLQSLRPNPSMFRFALSVLFQLSFTKPSCCYLLEQQADRQRHNVYCNLELMGLIQIKKVPANAVHGKGGKDLALDAGPVYVFWSSSQVLRLTQGSQYRGILKSVGQGVKPGEMMNSVHDQAAKKKKDEDDDRKKAEQKGEEKMLDWEADVTSTNQIVVESNFRVYAYTVSPISIDILTLFVDINFMLPNLVVGKLTRKSVQRAVGFGITAMHILQFLSSHTHPIVETNAAASAATVRALENNSIGGAGANKSSSHAKSSEESDSEFLSAEDAYFNSSMPPTIQDQIRLWEMEVRRLTYTRGVLYKGFPSVAKFRSSVELAKEMGCYLWDNSLKQYLFISEEKAEQFRVKFREGLLAT